MTDSKQQKQTTPEETRAANIEMSGIFNDRNLSSAPEGTEMHAPRNAPAADIDAKDQ
jgi:hypothetical protein